MEPREVPLPPQVFTMDPYRGFALQKPYRVGHAVTVLARRILPTPFLKLPNIAFFRYLGLNTMWYLQYHFTCDWLFHSRMSISFFELPGSLKGDRLSHAGTAEPLRVAPPEAVVYLLE